MTESLLEKFESNNKASTAAPAIPTFFKPVSAWPLWPIVSRVLTHSGLTTVEHELPTSLVFSSIHVPGCVK